MPSPGNTAIFMMGSRLGGGGAPGGRRQDRFELLQQGRVADLAAGDEEGEIVGRRFLGMQRVGRVAAETLQVSRDGADGVPDWFTVAAYGARGSTPRLHGQQADVDDREDGF